MPYFITDESADCSAWAVVKEDGEVVACHDTKESATEQMVAISLAEGLEPGGTYTRQERDSELESETRAAKGTVRVGDYVSWQDRGQDLYGEVKEVVTQGSINVPGSAIYLDGNDLDPAVLIQRYEQIDTGWQDTGEFVAKHVSSVQRTMRLVEPQDEDARDYTYSEVRQVNLRPPAYMRAAARQGLRYVEEGYGGDGLVDRTIREARAMAEGNVTADKWVRLRAWIARHLPDLDSAAARPGADGYPSPGVVAHLLWGSGPSKRAAQRALAYAEGVVTRLEAENAKRSSARGEAMSKVETRVQLTDFEIRETDEGMRFSGYAAVFNSDSEPLPFIERIAPGAFKRSLDSRNDIKLLWNHDTSEVLASSRAKTLTLKETDRGLFAEAVLANTSRGRDVAELIRRGDVDSMSFGFSVPQGGDEWSSDGRSRTLKSVRLHEVSIVAFPAYSGTAGSTAVRGLDAIAQRAEVDPDELADAILKVEEGKNLSVEEKSLLSKVIDTLSPLPEPVEEQKPSQEETDLLALKKKKLQLLMDRI